jgi:hypothetical protein
MRYQPEYIVNIQATGPYRDRFACEMQVAARGGFTMALLRLALLRPRNIEADGAHALRASPLRLQKDDFTCICANLRQR